MEFLPSGEESVTVFLAVGVRFGGFHRADLGAAGRGMGADAFGAAGGVDDVGGVAFLDRLIGALGFTGATANAVFGYFIGQLDFLLKFF